MNTHTDSPWEPIPDMWPVEPQTPKMTWRQVVTRGAGLGALAALALLVLGTLSALAVYAYLAASLPSPQELYARATPFKSTKILDRHGRLLFEVFDPQGGRRTIVRYGDIPEVMIQAIVATEDETYFSNPGFSPAAIMRALYYDLRAGGVVSGGSTITQQLVKNLYLTHEVTLSRKIKEAILAAELTRRYSKAEILEVYLNEIYFGNLSYGVGAAAEAYLGKSVSELTLADAALLAGLVQSPARYDPYLNPNAAIARRATVLRLMVESGYITEAEAEAAAREPLGLVPQQTEILAPHLVMYVREQLERDYGPEMLYKGGLRVYTTLDLEMQQLAEQAASAHIPALRERNATNAALVALDPQTGDVLAMLGSVDFWDPAISGQVNVATSPRQPGSTIKPFTYLAAMERGWTPATMVMDVEQDFPDGANPPYHPRNFDLREYGPISMRSALANSRNVPAVAALHQIGLPALLEMTQRLGIQSLYRTDYGLALTLGGGEVTLLEMTGAYGALANGGYVVAPRTILWIEDQDGNIVLPETAPPRVQGLDPRHAYLMTHILADNEARTPAFGPNSVLQLSFPAAVKTGTTNDYRDGWTVGYTPGLVAGVWVGNSDGAPTSGLGASGGAGLIWHDFMKQALAGKEHPGFARPDGIVEVEVCPISGQLRREDCPPARVELFASDNLPTGECSVHVRLKLDRSSGKLANPFCPTHEIEERAYEDYGPAWDEYLRRTGIEPPPRETCPLHADPGELSLVAPAGPLRGTVELRGSAAVEGFAYYRIEYGEGSDPQGWGRVTDDVHSPVSDGLLAHWNTSGLKKGPYTLRLIVVDEAGASREVRLRVEVKDPEPARRPTKTPKIKPPKGKDTPTPLPEPTSTPTLPPSPVPTETPTPLPTDTPTPLPTDTPEAVASPTPEAPDEEPTVVEEPTPTATETPELEATPVVVD